MPALRPGRVSQLKGVIFQSDGASTIGRIFIRPLESLDRLMAGLLPKAGEPSLAMHAGLHVVIDDQHEYVVEQLVGTFYMDFRNGLNWTRLPDFRRRDRGGWDVTVPATQFRGIDEPIVEQVVQGLNRIEGHPFLGEDCTAFIERAFGGRRLFADSPLLRGLGIGMRVGDPALPLLRRDAVLEPRTASLLQFDQIRDLPDALAGPESPNAWLWTYRLLPVLVIGSLIGHQVAGAHSSASRRSRPASSTARRFFK